MPVLVDQYGRDIESRADSGIKGPIDAWLADLLLGTKTTAGERVTAHTALTVMAFFACVRNISEDIAKFPKKVRRWAENGHVEMPEHPVAKLLRRPSRFMNRHVFWKTYFSHRYIYGNAYAYISRDGNGYPVELTLMHPSHVWQTENPVDGEALYRVTYKDGYRILMESEVFHMSMLGDCGPEGHAIIALSKQVLGAAIALQKYRGAFFGNGAKPSGVLTHPAELSAESANRLRKQFEANYSGSDNANAVMVLEEGLTWTQTSVNPDEAEAVNLTNITIEDICRLFRMPPHKIQHLAKATFSNIEHQGKEYAEDTLDPAINEFVCESDFKLIGQRQSDDGVYTHVTLNALMRADVATRTQHYKDMYYMGVMSANDISQLEDRNNVPGGDRYFVQQNLVPVDKLDQLLDSKNKTQAPASQNQDTQGDNSARALEGFRYILQSKIADIMRVEAERAPKAKRLDEYYAKHRKYVTEHLTPYISAVLLGMGSDANARDIAETYAVSHCEWSLQDHTSGEWPNAHRPAMNAAALMEQING